MLYRLVFLLIPFLGMCRPAGAQAPPAAETQVLQKASRLMLGRKYESAFKLLNGFDPRHRRPGIVLRQTELALTYYLRSREYEAFGFRDLGPLERLDSLRVRYTRAAIPYPFAVETVLKTLLKRYPTNYKLNRALADYYYQVQQCECAEADKSPSTLLALIARHYTIVHAHGLGDYRSYYALGYARMSQGRFAESVPLFKRAIALRPNYALAHFNLAYSYNELKQLPQAREAARSAARLFGTAEPQMSSDAVFMAEDIERRLGATTDVSSGKKPLHP
ncbi:MAG: tetratricopeptide repeat protein [Hymenobacter sp.]|nr:tetratricopeptide repeat protein [Hymenobacter sp.]